MNKGLAPMRIDHMPEAHKEGNFRYYCVLRYSIKINNCL